MHMNGILMFHFSLHFNLFICYYIDATDSTHTFVRLFLLYMKFFNVFFLVYLPDRIAYVGKQHCDKSTTKTYATI